MDKKNEANENVKEKKDKKPYVSPKLKKHGSLSDLKRLVI